MPNLEKAADEALKNWLSLLRAGQTAHARSTLQPLIDECKALIKSSADTSERVRNKAFILGVLFRGFQDFTELVQSTLPPGWIDEPQTVENAWDKLWAAKDRLAYVRSACDHKTIEWVLSQLESVEKLFVERFGPGLYSSPEIIAKIELCTVCDQDFRSCSHIAGRIYGGKRCAKIPRQIEARGISIVQHPVDPRCRLWPWQLKEENGQYEIVGTCILTAFRIDDFLDD